MNTPPSFQAALKTVASRKPHDFAIGCGSRRVTWAELDASSTRMAYALRDKGVIAGDLVTVALPNEPAFLQACYACWKLGATPQLASWRAPRAEMISLLELAQPRALIASVGAGSGQIRGVQMLTPEALDDGCGVMVDPLPDVVSASMKAPASGGSTGRPKVIVSTDPALVDAAAAAHWRVAEGDRVLMPAPLYHGGPFSLSVTALTHNATVFLLDKFEPETVLASVSAHRITVLYLVPTMMSRIWRLPVAVRERYNLSSLHTMWHLAAPCPQWLKRAWIDWLGAEKILELYAGTESQAGTRLNGVEWLEHPGSVGRPFRGEFKIVDEHGEELRRGQIGEVYMRSAPGEPVRYHYIGAEAKRLGDWESLGDIGYLDADGYLYLTDRISDMILVGGVNTYPAEIEAALEEHSLVQSSAVIGLPDDDLGSTVHAIVQTAGPIDVEELKSFVAARLAPHKRPRSYEFVTYPIRDDAGKVRRSQLRAERLSARKAAVKDGN